MSGTKTEVCRKATTGSQVAQFNNNNELLDDDEEVYDSDYENRFVEESLDEVELLRNQYDNSTVSTAGIQEANNTRELNLLPTTTSQPEARDMVQLLVAEIQCNPAIWNRQHAEYKQAHKKRVIWGKITEKLGIDGVLFFSFVLIFCCYTYVASYYGRYFTSTFKERSIHKTIKY